MLEKLKNGDLVITNSKISFLKSLTWNLINLRVMTLKEFKDAYFGTYDERAIYYLVDKYNYKYDVAKVYLDNFMFDDVLRQELTDNHLIIKTPLFKESIKRIVLLDVDVDPYIEKEINKYQIEIINIDNKNYKNLVYEFNDIEEEINFVCISICELLKTCNINNIKIANVTSEYIIPLKRMFKLYNLPINLNIGRSIFGIEDVNKFVECLKESNNIEKSLNQIHNAEIYDKVMSICNKYAFHVLDNTIIYLIEQELRNTLIDEPKYDNAVDCVNLNEITDDYCFILGFNQGVLPKVYKDDDYLSDYEKEEYGVFTSKQKNDLEKKRISNIITNHPHIILSYKLKHEGIDLVPSILIDELGLQVNHDFKPNFNYAHLYNEIELGKRLDDLIKNNKYSKDLELLYANYNIPYATYDNNYTKISKNDYLKFVNGNLLLSYSSLDNYYKCGFRYYLANVLKLNKYEETFMTYIGSLFHYILSKAFNDDFDFENEFNVYINGKEFTNKEKFFISKLKKDLLFTIETIKNQDNYSNLNDTLCEKAIYIDKSKTIKITFMGIIDKLKYKDYGDKKIVAIIDYKTGHPDIDLNKLIYGLSMQLSIYIYLVKKSNTENIEVAGFYLQKILHNKLNYEEDKDYNEILQKEYRLEGYSNNDVDILKEFDSNYGDSQMIKSMRTSSKGFYPYTKILDSKQMNSICEIVDEKIDNAIDEILNVQFDINPKKIDDKLIGCEYCKFRDICYMKNEDIVNYKSQNYKEFLGGDINA